MKDQKSINSLFDFSDLRKKPDQNQMFKQLVEHSEQSSQNEALLRAFKELREKLKLQAREINTLKDELKIANIKCRQSEQALSATLTNSLQLKQQLSQSASQCQQLRKKVGLMKEAAQSQANYYQEIQFTKQALLEMKTHTDELERERNRIMEVSLSEKMDLEEQINRLKSKIQSDNSFVEQLQASYSKARQTIIKQQNEIKKLTINFEEEVFNKNWQNDSFENQHLLNTIKELQREVNVLKAKSKKDKEKKAFLEDRIVELEEVSGFHNVKAQTFEGEIDMITKKYVKLDKKYKDLKNKLDKANEQKLSSEQSLSKLVFECEGLTNKLKILNINQVNTIIQQYQNKMSFISKKREQLQKEPYSFQTKPKQLKTAAFNTDPPKNQYFSFQPTYPEEPKSALSEYNKNGIVGQNNKSMFGSNMTFGDRQNEQSQNLLIQNRIKRQREEMQRKIKEKMLHRKLQASSPHEQFKLRGEYIKTYIEKQY